MDESDVKNLTSSDDSDEHSGPSTSEKDNRNAKTPKKNTKKVKEVQEKPEKPQPLDLVKGAVLANGRVMGTVYVDTPNQKYQAEIPDWNERTERTENYRKDIDQLVWRPSEKLEADGDVDRNKYWRALYRQFHGHVSHDQALEHLMSNSYSITEALENVDELLVKLEEPFAGLKNARVTYFESLRSNHTEGEKGKGALTGQTYTKEEVKEFFHFFRFTNTRQNTVRPCNHTEPICEDLDFEPRWSCSNCRKNDLSLSLEGVTNLCLICETHQELHKDGSLPSARNVHYWKEDLEKIAKWKELEESQKKAITRMEFEKHLDDIENERQALHKKKKLSEEEWEYIFSNRSESGRPKRKKEQYKGVELAKLLRPRPFPLFNKCDCMEEEEGDTDEDESGAEGSSS